MNQNKNQMDPQDTRNLFIFCVISLILWFSYNHFVAAPQRAALEKVRQTQIASVPKIEAPAEEEPKDRTEVLAETSRLKIDNDVVFGSISLKGARIDDISLKNYYDTLEKVDNVTVLSPKDTPHPRYIEHGWVSDTKNVNLPGPDTIWQAQGNSAENPLTLIWSNGQGLTFTKKFELDSKNLITITQTVANDSGREITLHPYGLVAQKGLPDKLESSWLLNEGAIGYIGDEFIEAKYNAVRKESRTEFNAPRGWLGITDKYWLTALIPAQEDTRFSYSYTGTPPAKKQKDTGLYQIDFTGPPVKLEAGHSIQNVTHVFAGPKKLLELEEYSKQLSIPRFDLAVNFGWFWFLSKPFFYALHYLAELTGNFGIGIILFTILIRTSVYPLTNASFKSFAKMKKVSPQIMQLRREYSDDKQKLQQELMAMYQREGVNPMAGCIPMLIQIPIFFALYKVLYITIEMRHAPFYGWIHDLSAPDPTSVFNLFGLIPWDPPGFLQIGVWPCLMLLTMIIQRKLNPPPQDPIQRDMALYFPFLMAYMMSQFAAGLVIYWTFSSTMSIIQQMIIMHRMGVPIHLLGQSPEEKAMEEEVNKGPAVHPLGEMMEEEIEEALFGDDPKPVTPRKKKKKK